VKNYFDVRLLMQVHGCLASASSMDVWLKREIALPIAPFVGLEVASGDGEFGAVIADVCYVIGSPRIDCYVAPDKELYDAALRKDPNPRSIQEIVNEHLTSGWERRDND